jgi:hypothetical protein
MRRNDRHSAKGDDMNSNQRSEMNNQTNNGGNEKSTPGSKGATRDGPMDHTYPQGASQQQGQPAGRGGTEQSGAGPGLGKEGQDELKGGSMQTQQSGGTGTVQGITDSHQRAMEQRSGASGQLEEPLAGRTAHHGSMGAMRSQTQGGGQRGPQDTQQPLQTGSMANRQSGERWGTQGGGQLGSNTGAPAVKQSSSMGAQQSTDRAGSQTGAASASSNSEQRDANRMHQSNDVAGGLPRSPGGTGPTNARQDSHLTGAQVHANQQKAEGGVHNSNDAAGGYPKSPGGANKLAADEKMDDDTGFSNR